MERRTIIHSTFVIERSFTQPPAAVFDAFADPAKKRRWFVDDLGHDVHTYEMDFRVGGSEHLDYNFKPGTPLPGVTLTNHSHYLQIVPERCIVTSSAMALDDKPISASLVTIELLSAAAGTDLICTYQGAFFEGADTPQMREGGWRTLLDKLATELAH